MSMELGGHKSGEYNFQLLPVASPPSCLQNGADACKAVLFAF